MSTKYLLTICLFLATASVKSQSYEYVYRNPSDSSYNCYLKVLPQTDNIRGLVVRDFTKLPDTSRESPYRFTKLCSEAGLMILYTNTSQEFPELFVKDSVMNLLDSMIVEVVEEHDIPEQNIFIGGISASGSRALRFVQYCEMGKSTLKINGVFVVDSPLDLARFYTSAKTHKQNFKEGMLWEANYMIPKFDSMFGGGPEQFYSDYQEASVFTHSDSLGGNAHWLKNTPIIMWCEPDLEWWSKERGASYHDINAYDLEAFATRLDTLGNDDVKLIKTSGKGFDQNGNRSCHSWSIVDETLLVDWIVMRLSEE